MAIQLQLRRGTTAQNNAFTGAAGELSYDTTLSQVRIHDNVTAGGKTLQDTSNLVTSVSSASTDTQYASAKCLYDNLATKQATLVSGTNIKSINGNSVLGSGDLELTTPATWAGITGSISDNAALTAALNAKATNADVVHLTGYETLSGTKVLSATQTNCLTQIPQDINLELNNGTLTLKAGSKVYVPNGANVFNVVTIASDLTWTPSGGTAEPLFVFYNTSSSSMMYSYKSEVYSGATAPTATPNMVWYDTTNNIIKWTTDSGSTWSDTVSFPVCVVTANSDREVTSIDQVFNGFGYIGSTVFALPGVKGLIPDGRNADGSLKNTEFTINNVLTRNDFTSTASTEIALYASGIGMGLYSYNADENYIYSLNEMARKARCVVGKIVMNGRITSFSPKTAFHAVDYNDIKIKEVSSLPDNPDLNTWYVIGDGSADGDPHRVIEFQAPTADNNYTWYRKYADGWVEQGQNNVVCAPRTAGTTFTYPITMAGAVNNVMAVINDSGDNYTMSVYVKSQTTTGFVGIAGYNGGSSGDRNINWQVSGMYA